MDKLELFNAVARVARPVHLEYHPIKSLDISFKDAGLDSLDILLICVFFCELYGIEEEIGKQLIPSAPQEIFDFLEKHKTREPSSVAEALEKIQ